MALSDQKLYSLKNDLINHIQSGQFKKAEKLYPRIKDKNIHDAELWRLFAGIHSKRGNFAEIVHCCNNILKITGDDFVTVYNLAVALQNLKRINEAIIQYEKCISLKPDYTNAYANCAHLYYITGDFEKSVIYYRRTLENTDTPEFRIQYSQSLIGINDYETAIQQLNYVLNNQPENTKALFLVAQSYYELQNYTESEKCYIKLYSLNPNEIKVINNLGRLYEETGRLDKSIEKYMEAINIDDTIATIHLNKGKAMVKIGEFSEAEKAFRRTIELAPELPEPYFNIGKLYNEKGELDVAKVHFEKALAMDIKKHIAKPDEFTLAVKYFLSNIEKPESFDEDKKAFVADLFDGYADKFDQHLVEGLKYKTPEIIDRLITSHVSRFDNRTLDLGCGTGLCCQYLKPRSISVTGVDLSPKMVDKARELNCYDHLIVGEVTEVVNNLHQELDLIVAADVFVYIGSLEDIFTACEQKMGMNSFFIFSTELLPTEIDNDFRLYDSGRYKHATGYIDRLTKQSDLQLVEHHFCVLRKENGKDVNGCVSVLTKNQHSN